MAYSFTPVPPPLIQRSKRGNATKTQLTVQQLNLKPGSFAGGIQIGAPDTTYSGWGYEGAVETISAGKHEEYSSSNVESIGTMYVSVTTRPETLRFRVIPWDITMRVRRSRQGPSPREPLAIATIIWAMDLIDQPTSASIPTFPEFVFHQSLNGIKNFNPDATTEALVTLPVGNYRVALFFSISCGAQAWNGITTTASVRLGRIWFLISK